MASLLGPFLGPNQEGAGHTLAAASLATQPGQSPTRPDVGRSIMRKIANRITFRKRGEHHRHVLPFIGQERTDRADT